MALWQKFGESRALNLGQVLGCSSYKRSRATGAATEVKISTTTGTLIIPIEELRKLISGAKATLPPDQDCGT